MTRLNETGLIAPGAQTVSSGEARPRKLAHRTARSPRLLHHGTPSNAADVEAGSIQRAVRVLDVFGVYYEETHPPQIEADHRTLTLLAAGAERYMRGARDRVEHCL